MRSRKAGNRQELFSELLGRYGDKAYNFAFRLTGNETEAQDLVQEAFLKAYQRLEDYEPGKPFDAWLGTVLHNIYVDGTRQLARLSTVSMDAAEEELGFSLADALAEPQRPPLEALSGSEAERSVQGALDRLEPEMRAAVVLCDMEGSSYEDAAVVMDCPVGTVRSRLARARSRLRGMLAPYVDPGEVGHGAA